MMMDIRNKMKNQKGFTLVELMVVIAIIGILAAIAVPKFASASETARGGKIAADLRTIDSAIQLAIANGEYTAGTAATDISGVANVVKYLSGTPTPPTGAWKTAKTPSGGTVTAAATYGIDANGRAVLDALTASSI